MRPRARLGVLSALTIVFALPVMALAGEFQVEEFVGGVPDDAGRMLTMLLVALATFVSEDLTCIAAGLLAASGRMFPQDAVVASYIGIVSGDIAIFWLGRAFGVALLNRAPFSWIVSAGAVRRASNGFARRGMAIVFLSRFLPGSRAATSFSAGALRQHAARFALLFAVAAAVWTPLVVIATMMLGKGVTGIYASYATWAAPAVAVALGLSYIFLRVILPAFTWRGRRLLCGRWKRLTHWEYWPMWACSGPVFLYVLFLGFVRYRRPTLFTVVNPGIPPDSGFIGESKDAIYKALLPAGDAVLPWERLPASLSAHERMAQLERFMERNGLGWPVVLKSDEGQRSLGVRVIRTAAAAREYLVQAPGDTLVQAYCPGVEFGIFYVRMPGEEGRIISITEKHITSILGDGHRTIEELILSDRRAVCMARVFLQRFESRLDEVPGEGEKVDLVDIGTHAQGALFTDGIGLLTPALTRRIDEISRAFVGFHFGRYDLRAPSREDLMAGRGIRIIELNGVTGQCSHVYSPGYSVFYMWRTIMAQWRIAFAIAQRNSQLGHKPMGKTDFLRHWRAAALRQRKVRESIAAATQPGVAELAESTGRA